MVTAVARRRLAAPQQWCRPSLVVHIHVAGEACNAGETHRHRRSMSISATSVLYLTCCQQNRLSVSQMSKNVEVKYVGYDRHIGTQT